MPSEFDELGTIGEAQLRSKGFYVRMATSAPRATPRPPSECVVLVVEDDDGTAQAIVRLLEHLGYRTRRARGRAEAAAALALRPAPDLALLDVNLPDVNGFDILDHIRQHPALKRLPVLMLTSLADRSHLARGLMLGADGYLTKPALPSTLADAVQAILR
jgi:DNA-binding response OmpR family regulator